MHLCFRLGTTTTPSYAIDNDATGAVNDFGRLRLLTHILER